MYCAPRAGGRTDQRKGKRAGKKHVYTLSATQVCREIPFITVRTHKSRSLLSVQCHVCLCAQSPGILRRGQLVVKLFQKCIDDTISGTEISQKKGESERRPRESKGKGKEGERDFSANPITSVHLDGRSTCSCFPFFCSLLSAYVHVSIEICARSFITRHTRKGQKGEISAETKN